jgi:hypothetical protein
MLRWSWLRFRESNRAYHQAVHFPREGDAIALGERAIASAGSYQVIPTISFNDLVFSTIFFTHSNRDLEHAAETYYMSGGVSAERIRNIAALYYADNIDTGILSRPLRILDFASGYGCVGRHIKNVVPLADLHAIDIHPAACKFNQASLGIPTNLSTLDPEQLEAKPEYDIVLAVIMQDVARFCISGERARPAIRPAGSV